MSAAVEVLVNAASAAQIADHLLCCDARFVPSLSGRVEIGAYANRITNNATRFEAWSDGTLIGLGAIYCNDVEKRIAYITSVSVLQAWTTKGIGARLLSQCIENARASGMRQINLEVAKDNTPAIRLYEKGGFVAGESNASVVTMELHLEGDERA